MFNENSISNSVGLRAFSVLFATAISQGFRLAIQSEKYKEFYESKKL